MTSLATAKKAAALAIEKKAENVVILNMAGVVNYCDYFVICSGSVSRHVKAVADGIADGLHESGIKVKFRQGLDTIGRSRSFFSSDPSGAQDGPAGGAWVLLDMGDVVVHVFEDASREFYALDHLWREAEVIG